MVEAKITKEQVKHIAKLCELTLSQEEEQKLSKMFTDTIEYIQVLDELDVSKVTETYQVTGQTNVFMVNEENKATLSHKEALKNASDPLRGHFATKGVFDE